LDNGFNIFEGITKNLYFIGISCIMCGGQILIIFVGGKAFSIADYKQTGALWACAIVLGFLSIPVGMIIRLIPDALILRLIPDYLKRRAHSKAPGINISDDEERYAGYIEPLAEVRDELAWLKRVKGGRINNLKFAIKNPRETFMPRKSPSHSREHSKSNSIHRLPVTPTREDSFGSQIAPTPDSRRRSRSMRSRSRSNSALGAATVMTGIVAGSIAAGWSPIDRRSESDFGQFPTRDETSQQQSSSVLGNPSMTDEPQEMEPASSEKNPQPDVPILSVPDPSKRNSAKSES